MILDTTAAAQAYCTAYWTYFSFKRPVMFPSNRANSQLYSVTLFSFKLNWILHPDLNKLRVVPLKLCKL